jgi:hypothetical protein
VSAREGVLSVKLLNRSTRKLSLALGGALFCERARELLCPPVKGANARSARADLSRWPKGTRNDATANAFAPACHDDRSGRWMSLKARTRAQARTTKMLAEMVIAELLGRRFLNTTSVRVAGGSQPAARQAS